MLSSGQLKTLLKLIGIEATAVRFDLGKKAVLIKYKIVGRDGEAEISFEQIEKAFQDDSQDNNQAAQAQL